ncbi:hypothetical protein DPMN_169004 [Dreissena polymorpha]|uniref:Uncharacterized protein n=1 Tax=Dreissena polymorpha TaxID=45954 RepID=A0A9D4F2Y5_DREPO|nr:hypothetical protein DPMN_169004 [Dreissena polymorpha]
MDIMHVISLGFYVKNCGCYGNSENGGISDNSGAGRGPYCLTIALFLLEHTHLYAMTENEVIIVCRHCPNKVLHINQLFDCCDFCWCLQGYRVGQPGKFHVLLLPQARSLWTREE